MNLITARNLVGEETTGYDIKEKLSELELERDLLRSDFDDSLYSFEGDEKSSPVEVYERYREIERAIAEVQTLQAMYNGYVQVRGGYPLTSAIKYLGACVRFEGMWRGAKRGKSYIYRGAERDKDTEYAKAVVTDDVIRDNVKTAAKEVTALRREIAKANATVVKIEDLLS